MKVKTLLLSFLQFLSSYENSANFLKPLTACEKEFQSADFSFWVFMQSLPPPYPACTSPPSSLVRLPTQSNINILLNGSFLFSKHIPLMPVPHRATRMIHQCSHLTPTGPAPSLSFLYPIAYENVHDPAAGKRKLFCAGTYFWVVN